MIESVFLHEFRLAGAVHLGDWILWRKPLQLWNKETRETIQFKTLEEAYKHEIDGKTIKQIIDEEDITLFSRYIQFDGGSGASSPKRIKINGGGTGRGRKKKEEEKKKKKEKPAHFRADLPAKMNNRIKTKSEVSAIQAFREKHAKAKFEHIMTIDKDGFVNGYGHGGRNSVGMPKYNPGDLVIHNHPKNANHPTGGARHLSDTDLVSMATSPVRGVVAVTERGYFKVEKRSHFKGAAFSDAVKAIAPTISYDSWDKKMDTWLLRNQKKYGYRYINHKDF